jgi:hypothetical protein
MQVLSFRGGDVGEILTFAKGSKLAQCEIRYTQFRLKYVHRFWVSTLSS